VLRYLLYVALCVSCAAADADVDLRQIVGPDEYAAMGLAKLSPAEQQRLSAWLLRQRDGQEVPLPSPTVTFSFGSVRVKANVATEPAPAAPAVAPVVAPPSVPQASAVGAVVGSAAAFGLEEAAVDGDVKEVHAHIVGEFTGWNGKTTFTLDNGQVWRQSNSGIYSYKAQDPEIVIVKEFIGYRLRVVATQAAVHVRRIK